MKHLIIALAITIGCLLYVSAASASTPTPTPRPTYTRTPTALSIGPTATSPYGYFRNTPTPFTINPPTLAVAFDTVNTSGLMADTIINSYRSLGVVGDFASFIALSIIAIALLVRLLTRLNKNNGE